MQIRPLLLGLLALTTATASAQIVVPTGQKWDAKTAVLLKQNRDTRATAAPAKFVISVSDAQLAADSIRRLGGEATVIDEQTLTARLPLSLVEPVANMQCVRHINVARRFKLKNNTSRTLSNVDSVHNGLGLETPYTGKGVIVGVIDGGFQYRHPAFLDDSGNTRVLAIWNHSTDNAKPTTTIPTGYDGQTDTYGHATHVTGIAAGSKHTNNAYYGMAPEADIVMVASQLYEDNILEEAQWIKSFAESQGKPWVINMSFGSQEGPHDGTTDFDQSMSALGQAGGIMSAAMGNEGEDALHASATLAKGEETTLLVSNSDSYGSLDEILLDFWGNATDGKTHFTVTPFYYNASTKKAVDIASSKYTSLGIGSEINANNKKEHYEAYIDMDDLATLAGVRSTSNLYFGFRIKALTDNASFHAWCESGYGELITKNGYGIAGDSKYLVGQGAASVPRAIGVASYNGASSWTAAYDGNAYAYTSYRTTGAMSSFSSPGPSLGTDVKPTVSAPGATITSAFNRYVPASDEYTTFSKKELSIVCAVNSTTGAPVSYSSATTSKNDFYGVMCGTSMATPAVSGIIALWLQANPNLTPEDVAEILRTTSTRDTYTGGTTTEWTATAGYGKINAYAGLKAALKLADPSAIDPAIAYDAPVSIEKSSDAWHILFNASVERADISVTSLSGQTVLRRTLTSVRPGDEQTLDLSTLTPSIYVLRVATPHTTVTRKLAVQ